MRTDVVLGAIGDYHYDQIKYWVNSLNQSGFEGRKILLSYNSNLELVKRLVDNHIEVYEMNTNMFGEKIGRFESHTGRVNKSNTDILVHHMRFFHMWQLINQLGKENFNYVIHTDVRDVVFQYSPSEWLSSFYCANEGHRKGGRTIIAPSEYLTYGEESWNAELGLTNFGPIVFEYALRDSLVYNVGSTAAWVDCFLDMALMTYLLCHRTNKLADQPSQALLFSTALKGRVYPAGTKDAWALQCGTLIENYDKYKDQLRAELPHIDKNGYIVNYEQGEAFCLVHQYDRVPEFKTLIEEKFK